MLNATSLHIPAFRAMCELLQERGVSMVLDCGMLQGIITEDEYIELLCRNAGYFDWFASVDVPGSLSLTNGNYNYLRDYLPRDVHGRLLYVLQGSPEAGFTGAQCRTLVKVLTHATPYVGIGGLAPYCRRGQFSVVERYLDSIYAAFGGEACRLFHLFGVGNYRLLRKYRNRFGSADSSTWLCGVHGEKLRPGGGRDSCTVPHDVTQLLRTNAALLVGWARADAEQCPLFADGPFRAQSRYDTRGEGSPYLLDTLT
jgi:hypothetical protein